MKHHSKFISYKELREWLEKYIKYSYVTKLITFDIVSVLPELKKYCKCECENGHTRFIRIDYAIESIRKERV